MNIKTTINNFFFFVSYSEFYRFSPTGILPGHPPGLSPHSHPAIVTPGPKQELMQSEINHRSVNNYLYLL